MTKREELLSEAKNLGLEFPKNIKTEALEIAVNELKNEKVANDAYVEAGGKVEPEPTSETAEEIEARLKKEYEEKLEQEKAKMTANMEVNLASKSNEAAENRLTIGQAKLKARREAMALVRVNVTCKDPMKAAWPGELITAGNDVVGDITKYVQFNTEEGYHIPKIVYNVLKDKMCTTFINKKINGQMTQVAKSIKAYTIEVLPALTPEELEELARDQTARHAIGDD